MSNSKRWETLPDFLGIGAQRAGTTWLNANLQQHPDIWLPFIKELHYFDRTYRSTPSALSVDALHARVFGRGHHSARWRRAFKRTMRPAIESRDAQSIRWHLKYFLGRYSDRWYASLFKMAGNRLKGEITPAYCFLTPEDIAYIREIMPELRILYLIRNPIDRAWSAIKYHVWRRVTGQAARSSQPIDDLSLVDFMEIAENPGFVERGDYVSTIENWGARFPRERFFIGFFEDLVDTPEPFLRSVFDFLGVDSSEKNITQLAFKKSNPSPKKPMPPEFREYLTRRYYPQIQILSDKLGSHAVQWLREAEEVLSS